MRPAFYFLLIIFTCSFSISIASDLKGTWKNESITLTITSESGTKVSGSMVFNAMKFSLSVQKSIYGYQGHISNEIGQFPVFITLKDDTLKLETEGATYELKKVTVKAQPEVNKPPVADTPPVATETLEELDAKPVQEEATKAPISAPPIPEKKEPPPEKPEPIVTRVATKSELHPMGFPYYIPPKWRVQKANEQTVFLVPPDFAKVNDMQAEVIMLVSEPKANVSRIQDPKILSICEQIMAQIVPGMQQAGQPEEVGENQMRFVWEGFHAQLQRTLRGTIWVKLYKDKIIALLGAAEPENADQRADILQEIFSYAGDQKQALDPSLIGLWALEVPSTEEAPTSTLIALTPDGQCGLGTEQSASMAQMMQAPDLKSFSGVLTRFQGWSKIGTWSNRDQILNLQWSNTYTQSWEFTLKGQTLILNSAGKTQTWVRVSPR